MLSSTVAQKEGVGAANSQLLIETRKIDSRRWKRQIASGVVD
jgi:hypothetical protein